MLMYNALTFQWIFRYVSCSSFFFNLLYGCWSI